MSLLLVDGQTIHIIIFTEEESEAQGSIRDA